MKSTQVRLIVKALLFSVEQAKHTVEELEGKIADTVGEWVEQHYDGPLVLSDDYDEEENACEGRGPPRKELKAFIDHHFSDIAPPALCNEIFECLYFDACEWPNGRVVGPEHSDL